MSKRTVAYDFEIIANPADIEDDELSKRIGMMQMRVYKDTPIGEVIDLFREEVQDFDSPDYISKGNEDYDFDVTIGSLKLHFGEHIHIRGDARWNATLKRRVKLKNGMGSPTIDGTFDLDLLEEVIYRRQLRHENISMDKDEWERQKEAIVARYRYEVSGKIAWLSGKFVERTWMWNHLNPTPPTLSEVVFAGWLGHGEPGRHNAATTTAETEFGPRIVSCDSSRQLATSFLDELQLKPIPVISNGKQIGTKWSLKWELPAEEPGSREICVHIDVMNNAVHWKRRQKAEGIVLP